MARNRLSVEEVVNLLDDEEDLAEIGEQSLDHESDSEDGDTEEADYVSASGTAELIPAGLQRTSSIPDDDEPAFQDSLLFLDSTLASNVSDENYLLNNQLVYFM